jgi:hypothetical protein
LPVEAARIVATGDLFYDVAPDGSLEFPERFGRICERHIPQSGESISKRA